MFVHVILPFLALWAACTVLTYLGTKTLISGANQLRAHRRLRRIRAFGAIRRSIIAERDDPPRVGDWRQTVIEAGSIAPDLWTETKEWDLAGECPQLRIVRPTVRERRPCGCRYEIGCRCRFDAPAVEAQANSDAHYYAVPRWSWSNFPGPFGMNYPPPVVPLPVAPPSPYKWSRYETCWGDPLPPFRPALADTRFFDPRDQEHVDFLATAMRNNQLAAQQLATAQAQQESALGQVLNFVATYGPLLVFGAAGAFTDFTNRRGPK